MFGCFDDMMFQHLMFNIEQHAPLSTQLFCPFSLCIILTRSCDIMQNGSPAFIIKYLQCREPGHEPEKLNLVCLNKKCQDTSLICSLCCLDRHKGHHFKPLKVHLEELYYRYSAQDTSYSQQLQQLEERRNALLAHLARAVEAIAKEVCKLEQSIITAYERLREEMQDNAWRRSRFVEFYLAMVRDNYGDPNFQVKNYLFKEKANSLTDRNVFEGLTNTLTQCISTISNSFIEQPDQSSVKSKVDPSPGEAGHFLLPANILQEGRTFTQTNFTINAPHLCLMDQDISLINARKVRVSVLAYGPFSFLAFGTIKREEFGKANFQFKGSLSPQYFSSDGKGKGVPANFLSNVTVDTKIDFSFMKNQLKVSTNTNNAVFAVNQPNTCLFFVIEGNTKIMFEELNLLQP